MTMGQIDEEKFRAFLTTIDLDINDWQIRQAIDMINVVPREVFDREYMARWESDYNGND